MKARKIENQVEMPSEPQPGDTIRYFMLDDDSELGQYFLKVDAELCDKYDYGLLDDESL